MIKGWAVVEFEDDIKEGHIVVGDDKILFREIGSKTVELPIDVDYVIEQEY